MLKTICDAPFTSVIARYIAEVAEQRGKMLGIDIMNDAYSLVASHGDRARDEAATRAAAFEKQGLRALAIRWQRVEAALRDIQGTPHFGEHSSATNETAPLG